VQNEFQPPAPLPVGIPGPAGRLEARADDPASDASPRAVGVVCHPHPLHGGTMQNKVVHTLARAMQQTGAPTVRFNFRGVGASEGVYADGVGEVEDALAVIAWARARWNCGTLWLAGFSFGAAVSLQACAAAAPAALVTVAPPVGRLLLDPIARPGCPWLVVQGDCDELVDFATVKAWVNAYDPPPEFAPMHGAEHFFHGRLGELRTVVIDFLKEKAAF
jgi:alpha/beta superfamily hydrolase